MYTVTRTPKCELSQKCTPQITSSERDFPELDMLEEGSPRGTTSQGTWCDEVGVKQGVSVTPETLLYLKVSRLMHSYSSPICGLLFGVILSLKRMQDVICFCR